MSRFSKLLTISQLPWSESCQLHSGRTSPWENEAKFGFRRLEKACSHVGTKVDCNPILFVAGFARSQRPLSAHPRLGFRFSERPVSTHVSRSSRLGPMALVDPGRSHAYGDTPFDLIRQPAITDGFAANGLPRALQLARPMYRDDVVLRARRGRSKWRSPFAMPEFR